MGGYPKQDAETRRKSRKEQNAAYRAKREADGLRTVTKWTRWGAEDQKDCALVKVTGAVPDGLLYGTCRMILKFTDDGTVTYKILKKTKRKKDPRQLEFETNPKAEATYKT